MNRHHQSWITVIHRRLFPRCYGGFGRSWGYPQIIQSWGSMVTTRDPNDKFTKPHDIPMIFLYSPIFHGNSHELSTDLPYSYGIPMIFLWYSHEFSPDLPTPPDPWPSCPAPARLCARCSPRRSPGTRTDRCHRAPGNDETPEGLTLGWEEPDKPVVFMTVLPKMVGKP